MDNGILLNAIIDCSLLVMTMTEFIDPELDLQTDIIFGDNCGVKINKFLDYIEKIVSGRYLGSNTWPYLSTT